MRLAYLTLDEVNQDLAHRLAGAHRISLEVVIRPDEVARAAHDAVLLDLDSLPPDEREANLTGLLASLGNGPIAVHSYNLEASELRSLRRRGVVPARRLSAGLFRRLRAAVKVRRQPKTVA
jgi:hypothetical protein